MTVTREFLVDFLGALVPGILFLIFVFPAILLPIASLPLLPSSSFFAVQEIDEQIVEEQEAPPVTPPSLADTQISVGAVLFLLLPTVMGFLAIAYVSGYLFFRQELRPPDRASFHKTRGRREEKNDGMVRTLDGVTVVEYPYHFLKWYLKDRGIDYLANHIPWGDSEGSDQAPVSYDDITFDKRSKHFINALKTRLYMDCPQHVGPLLLNEAHIRLASSMWYVSRLISFLALFGIAIPFLPFVFSFFVHVEGSGLPLMWVAVLPSGTLLLSLLVQYAIEHSLHYQREREILAILNAAYWADLTDKSSAIFNGLSNDSTESARVPISRPVILAGNPPTDPDLKDEKTV